MARAAYCHDAVVYATADELFAAALAFIQDGLAADGAVLVSLGREGNSVLASQLGADAASVRFADPADDGGNPARQMAQRVAFAHSVEGDVRLIGDLGWAVDRVSAQAEAVLAEALLDTLAGAGRPMSMLCGIPVRLADLPGVLGCHEGLRTAGGWRANRAYRPDVAAALFAAPLPEPRAPVSVYCSNGRPLSALRDFVAEHATAAHVPAARADDLVLAAHEVASNSLRHAGSEPIVRIWREPEMRTVVCEIRDHGVIADPMAGRLFPDTDREDGRGLWLANQLCDLAQVRSSVQDGTTVRLHIRGA